MNVQEILNHELFSQRESHYLRWYPKNLTNTRLLDSRPSLSQPSKRGAYIHVPFCEKLCKFCPFYKVVSNDNLIDEFVRSLNSEIYLYSQAVEPKPLDFVYFGGGTPSVLKPSQLESILGSISKHHGLHDDCEISMETHPSHAKGPFLADAKSIGINRISMGIQSFDNDALTELGATHNSRDSQNAVYQATLEFDNVAIDLLFAYQTQTEIQWKCDLVTTMALGIPHISCYSLVSDPVKLAPKTDELSLHLLASSLLKESGYLHYASCASGGFDMSLPGYECRYEFEHWRAPQAEFFGLGPGAFGFINSQVTVNTLSFDRYLKSFESTTLPLVSATYVSSVEQKHRFMALGVKTLAISLTAYHNLFGTFAVADFEQQFQHLEQMGFGVLTPASFDLTELGALFVDYCSSVFYSAEQLIVEHPEEPHIRAHELAFSA